MHLTHDSGRFPFGEDKEIVSILIDATHFDVPGHFCTGSEEHSLLLFDPRGDLKGSFTRWHTYLGALTFMVSGGHVNGHFGRLYTENPLLYNTALAYLRQALRRSKA